MPCAIRIKLIDLLKILSERPSGETAARHLPFLEKDLEAVKAYLQTSGPVASKDLAADFSISKGATLRRLNLLRERGVLINLPGDKYGILGGRQ